MTNQMTDQQHKPKPDKTGPEKTEPETTSWDAAFCLDRLADYEKTIAIDPLTNSVRQLAHTLLLAEDRGEIDRSRLKALVSHFAGEALDSRINTMVEARAGLPPDSATATADLFTDALNQMDFAALKRYLEKPVAGVVFTAHPTFAMSGTMRQSVAERATARLQGLPEPAIWLDATGPEKPILLVQEHATIQQALAHAKAALGGIYRCLLTEIRARHPARWTELTPNLITLASWVGYDLDGRTDIHWSETLGLRLREKTDQILDYVDRLRTLNAELKDQALEAVAARLAAAADLSDRQAQALAGDLTQETALATAANLLSSDHPARLTSLNDSLHTLAESLDRHRDNPVAIDLALLKTDMTLCGLGRSLIHMRINAAQIRSALREDFNLAGDEDFMGRTTYAALANRAAKTTAIATNSASLFYEPMTARRQLKLVAQILKHVDADAAIRFLIAESETPAIIMGAIYLARLYGIDRMVDISPLFETPDAIEAGGRFMRQLIKDPLYLETVRRRGRLAIQIGFSDSGRFMGQIGANLAIERLQSHLIRRLEERGATDLEVIIFNTHGESMGRGAYPGRLKERFDYLLSPWVRKAGDRTGIHLITESSFQGGDGYLHFGTPLLAHTTLSGLLTWRLTPPKPMKGDRFYKRADLSWDLYRILLTWQKQLFHMEGYHIMIGAFAPNLLPITGSRPSRRQSGNSIVGPKALRAIPHNAILQQLALPINVAGGLGFAASGREEEVIRLARKSERFSFVLGMAREARRLTSLPVLRAYAMLYDPSFWAAKAATLKAAAATRQCSMIAGYLEESGTAAGIGQAANRFALDLTRFDLVLRGVFGRDEDRKRYAFRRSLHTIHAIRQAYIMRGFLLATRIPAISPRYDLDRDTVFSLAFSLRFDALATRLAAIFPANSTDIGSVEQISEPADDLVDLRRGYPGLHQEVIIPLRDLQNALGATTVSLAHYYNAYG